MINDITWLSDHIKIINDIYTLNLNLDEYLLLHKSLEHLSGDRIRYRIEFYKKTIGGIMYTDWCCCTYLWFIPNKFITKEKLMLLDKNKYFMPVSITVPLITNNLLNMNFIEDLVKIYGRSQNCLKEIIRLFSVPEHRFYLDILRQHNTIKKLLMVQNDF